MLPSLPTNELLLKLVHVPHPIVLLVCLPKTDLKGYIHFLLSHWEPKLLPCKFRLDASSDYGLSMCIVRVDFEGIVVVDSKDFAFRTRK
jgi:hypothetical protein